jgi:hypothetical protein
MNTFARGTVMICRDLASSHKLITLEAAGGRRKLDLWNMPRLQHWNITTSDRDACICRWIGKTFRSRLRYCVSELYSVLTCPCAFCVRFFIDPSMWYNQWHVHA